jgi:arylformamidase
MLYDISEPISPATAVWPGDTAFSAHWVMRIDGGCSCNVSTIRMSVHCGTHTDAPLHFLAGSAAIDQVALERYLGPCRVVDVVPQGQPPLVPAGAFAGLGGVSRVLFRTRREHDATRFDERFCALGQEAARAAVRHGCALVGIDTPSMDTFASKTMDAHKELLAGGVAILENLDLSRVPAGDYELIALPLRIRDGDASPVRAVLRTLP